MKRFRVSSLSTREDLIPTSRGPRAEIKGRGFFLVPLIWAFFLGEPISSPLRFRVQQQSQGVFLLPSCAAKQCRSKHEEKNLGPVLGHDYG